MEEGLRLVPGVAGDLAEALEQTQGRIQQVVGQESGAVHHEVRRSHRHALTKGGPECPAVGAWQEKRLSPQVVIWNHG